MIKKKKPHGQKVSIPALAATRPGVLIRSNARISVLNGLRSQGLANDGLGLHVLAVDVLVDGLWQSLIHKLMVYLSGGVEIYVKGTQACRASSAATSSFGGRLGSEGASVEAGIT